jgi:hypothetical protein
MFFEMLSVPVHVQSTIPIPEGLDYLEYIRDKKSLYRISVDKQHPKRIVPAEGYDKIVGIDIKNGKTEVVWEKGMMSLIPPVTMEKAVVPSMLVHSSGENHLLFQNLEMIRTKYQRLFNVTKQSIDSLISEMKREHSVDEFDFIDVIKPE